MNLFDIFHIPVERTPEKTALQFQRGADAQVYSYAALYARVDQLAAGLQARGLRKGERVALFAGNSPEFVLAYLAVARLGAVVVPINVRYRKLELEYILADSAPRMVVLDRDMLSLLAEIAAAVVPETTIVTDELAAWIGNASALEVPFVDGDDTLFIMYTSGTTGRSKGAMMSHSAILANVTALLSAWAWSAEDRLLLVLPLFHTHGLVVGLHCALAAGATVLLRTQYEGARTVDELLAGVATTFFAVPTIYVRLVDEFGQRSAQERAALEAMRLFCSGSAPLAPEVLHAIHELTGHTILERYGMTETGMNLSNPYAGPRVAGSVGTPLPGVSMRIVRVAAGGDAAEGDAIEDVAEGEEGELLVRGANLFSGYWNAPEKTATSFTLDAQQRAWFHTGDLARQDPDTGYVTLLGRRHELIISGGFNIYPREIEEMLCTFPGVREAAVIGMKHAEWGEVPAAYLVCDSTLDEEKLVLWCRTQLASFKVPKAIHVVEGLPRNAMGKVQKNLLKSA